MVLFSTPENDANFTLESLLFRLYLYCKWRGKKIETVIIYRQIISSERYTAIN